MKAYYFVLTPVNYLYALQASKDNRFNFSENHLIVLSDFNRSILQFKEIINENDWNTVRYPFIGSKKNKKSRIQTFLANWYNLIAFRLIISKIRSYESNIFWGNYNHKYSNYIKKYENIIFLDDGFSTINIIENLNEHQTPLSKNKKFSFYSIFNIHSRFHNVIKHKLDTLSIKHYVPFCPDVVFFIGQPLVYNNVITLQQYIETINTIFNYFSSKGKTCIYVPHRSTNRQYIPDDWKVNEFNFPIEFLHKMAPQNTPYYFTTFYSTGVYNLKLLYGLENEKCIFWEIPNEWLKKEHEKKISSIYSYLKSNQLIVKTIK